MQKVLWEHQKELLSLPGVEGKGEKALWRKWQRNLSDKLGWVVRKVLWQRWGSSLKAVACWERAVWLEFAVLAQVGWDRWETGWEWTMQGLVCPGKEVRLPPHESWGLSDSQTMISSERLLWPWCGAGLGRRWWKIGWNSAVVETGEKRVEVTGKALGMDAGSFPGSVSGRERARDSPWRRSPALRGMKQRLSWWQRLDMTGGRREYWKRERFLRDGEVGRGSWACPSGPLALYGSKDSASAVGTRAGQVWIEKIGCGGSMGSLPGLGPLCLGAVGNGAKFWDCGLGYWVSKDFPSVWQVACGQDHSMFLTDKGEVYSCGWGADGQTGSKPFTSSGWFRMEQDGAVSCGLSRWNPHSVI